MEKRMERQVHQTGEEIKKAGIRRRNEGHTIFRKVGPFFLKSVLYFFAFFLWILGFLAFRLPGFCVFWFSWRLGGCSSSNNNSSRRRPSLPTMFPRLGMLKPSKSRGHTVFRGMPKGFVLF